MFRTVNLYVARQASATAERINNIQKNLSRVLKPHLSEDEIELVKIIELVYSKDKLVSKEEYPKIKSTLLGQLHQNNLSRVLQLLETDKITSKLREYKYHEEEYTLLDLVGELKNIEPQYLLPIAISLILKIEINKEEVRELAPLSDLLVKLNSLDKEKLSKEGLKSLAETEVDEFGSQLIHWAAQNDKAGLIKVLVRCGANVNAIVNKGRCRRTALDLAAFHSYGTAYKTLQDAKGRHAVDIKEDKVESFSKEEKQLIDLINKGIQDNRTYYSMGFESDGLKEAVGNSFLKAVNLLNEIDPITEGLRNQQLLRQVCEVKGVDSKYILPLIVQLILKVENNEEQILNSLKLLDLKTLIKFLLSYELYREKIILFYIQQFFQTVTQTTLQWVTYLTEKIRHALNMLSNLLKQQLDSKLEVRKMEISKGSIYYFFPPL